jgi:hypothetical protein
VFHKSAEQIYFILTNDPYPVRKRKPNERE